MEWLKAILRNAVITNGKLDMEAVMKAVNTEFPKHAVPKQVYNNKVRELSTANTTIVDLKKNNAENGELQTKIKDYEIEIKNLKEAVAKTQKEYALKNKLKESGVVDADYMIYKYGGLDKFTFDNEGTPVGIDDVLNPMRESFPHLFKTENREGYSPIGGGNLTVENHLPKTDLTLGSRESCSVIIQCMLRN